MNIRLIGDSKWSVGVSVSMYGCSVLCLWFMNTHTAKPVELFSLCINLPCTIHHVCDETVLIKSWTKNSVPKSKPLWLESRIPTDLSIDPITKTIINIQTDWREAHIAQAGFVSTAVIDSAWCIIKEHVGPKWAVKLINLTRQGLDAIRGSKDLKMN